MEKLERYSKMFLDVEKEIESEINQFLDAKDGVVECYEYSADSGYGVKTRLFMCYDNKHESMSIIRQTWNDTSKKWNEEGLDFDSDSFVFLKALINGKKDEFGGKYSLVRDY